MLDLNQAQYGNGNRNKSVYRSGGNYRNRNSRPYPNMVTSKPDMYNGNYSMDDNSYMNDGHHYKIQMPKGNRNYEIPKYRKEFTDRSTKEKHEIYLFRAPNKPLSPSRRIQGYTLSNREPENIKNKAVFDASLAFNRNNGYFINQQQLPKQYKYETFNSSTLRPSSTNHTTNDSDVDLFF